MSVWNKNKNPKIKSGVVSVLAPSYCREKKTVELNLVMFSQYLERAHYFFSRVEKSVMPLVICLQESDLFQGIMVLCYQLLNLLYHS